MPIMRGPAHDHAAARAQRVAEREQKNAALTPAVTASPGHVTR